MICRYCGLETGAGVSHCSQVECIAALTAEIERAKRLIGQEREHGHERRGGATHAPAGRDGGAFVEPA